MMKQSKINIGNLKAAHPSGDDWTDSDKMANSARQQICFIKESHE